MLNNSLKSIHLLFLTLFGFGQFPAVFADTPADKAGEITLALGKAYLVNSKGESTQLVRGANIFVGDRIETASDGHVHVHFIDNALLSIRPSSVLKIEAYEFDIAEPQNSQIKLDLSEGVARAISGEASKAARERFRLNTPVAAIGVRGTDFTVGAQIDSTKVKVNEGVVVLAPFSDSCLVGGLGPCSEGGLELFRSGASLASLQIGESAPSIVAARSVRMPGELQRQIQALSAPSQTVDNPGDVTDGEVAGTAQNAPSNDVFLEAVASPKIRIGAEIAVNKAASTDFLPTDPIIVSDTGEIDQFDHTPPYALTAGMLEDRQLVWGYYGETSSSVSRLALSFNEARQSRRVSVGNLNYGLFREGAGPIRVDADLKVVGFQLSSAQAVFNSNTGVTVMRVDGGTLDIDFENSTFGTMLSLGHEMLGQVEFSATGRIVDGGFLRAFESTQRLSGAVSFDGSEAGYLFEKQLGNGLISGLTLWDAK